MNHRYTLSVSFWQPTCKAQYLILLHHICRHSTDSTNNALNSKAKPSVHYKCYNVMCLPQFSQQTVLYYILIRHIHCICVQSIIYTCIWLYCKLCYGLQLNIGVYHIYPQGRSQTSVYQLWIARHAFTSFILAHYARNISPKRGSAQYTQWFYT